MTSSLPHSFLLVLNSWSNWEWQVCSPLLILILFSFTQFWLHGPLLYSSLHNPLLLACTSSALLIWQTTTPVKFSANSAHTCTCPTEQAAGTHNHGDCSHLKLMAVTWSKPLVLPDKPTIQFLVHVLSTFLGNSFITYPLSSIFLQLLLYYHPSGDNCASYFVRNISKDHFHNLQPLTICICSSTFYLLLSWYWRTSFLLLRPACLPVLLRTAPHLDDSRTHCYRGSSSLSSIINFPLSTGSTGILHYRDML